MANTSFGGCITVVAEAKIGVGSQERRGTLCRPARVLRSVILAVNAVLKIVRLLLMATAR